MKKAISLLLTALLLCALTACGSVKIEDTNGPDDFSLNTITDQNILKLDLPSGGYGVRTTSNLATCYGKEFSGVTEILSTNLIAGTFAVDLMDFTVTGGNFRMVVVNDGKIVADIAPGTDQISLDGLKGDVSLRIAGESAAFSFSMLESEYNSFVHP